MAVVARRKQLQSFLDFFGYIVAEFIQFIDHFYSPHLSKVLYGRGEI